MQAALRFLKETPEILTLSRRFAFHTNNLSWSYVNGSSFVVVQKINIEDLYNLYHAVFLNALLVADANLQEPDSLHLAFGQIVCPENMVESMRHLANKPHEKWRCDLRGREPFTHRFDDFRMRQCRVLV